MIIRFSVGALLGAAVLLSACGNTGQSCGAGTHAEGGRCVPDTTSQCGEGTVLSNGECVPDGTLICGQGTTYDPESGTCLPDIDSCAEGTVLVDGVCVP